LDVNANLRGKNQGLRMDYFEDGNYFWMKVTLLGPNFDLRD